MPRVFDPNFQPKIGEFPCEISPAAALDKWGGSIDMLLKEIRITDRKEKEAPFVSTYGSDTEPDENETREAPETPAAEGSIEACQGEFREHEGIEQAFERIREADCAVGTDAATGEGIA